MIVTSFETERIVKNLIQKVINGSFLDILHQAEHTGYTISEPKL